MHTPAQLARLKSVGKAYNHFLRFQNLYRGYAVDVRAFYARYPKVGTESYVFMVKRMILDCDQYIWGIANGTSMTADEIADTFARLVVGHEGEAKGEPK